MDKRTAEHPPHPHGERGRGPGRGRGGPREGRGGAWGRVTHREGGGGHLPGTWKCPWEPTLRYSASTWLQPSSLGVHARSFSAPPTRPRPGVHSPLTLGLALPVRPAPPVHPAPPVRTRARSPGELHVDAEVAPRRGLDVPGGHQEVVLLAQEDLAVRDHGDHVPEA